MFQNANYSELHNAYENVVNASANVTKSDDVISQSSHDHKVPYLPIIVQHIETS